MGLKPAARDQFRLAVVIQIFPDESVRLGEAIVNEVVLKHGGSISAEHGIGRLKRDAMRKIKSPVELQMMRDLKRLFDPLNILNPGKVLPE